MKLRVKTRYLWLAAHSSGLIVYRMHVFVIPDLLISGTVNYPLILLSPKGAIYYNIGRKPYEKWIKLVIRSPEGWVLPTPLLLKYLLLMTSLSKAEK